MVTVEQALETILSNVRPVGTEEVGILECAGRYLARDCVADSDMPVVPVSAMDGYAVRAADLEGASEDSPATLETIEEIPAGKVPQETVGPGQAARIMTGAPVPDGADTVVMVEYTGQAGGGKVKIKISPRAGEHVRPAGEALKKGAVVLRAGKRLAPADAGMLAATGNPAVTVAKKPAVGIISTGDEVIPPERPLEPGLVRNSNSYALHALALDAGSAPVSFGIVPDVKEPLLETFREAAEQCDAVLTTGGVSVGDYDIVRDILAESGNVFFQKVRMKPGKPVNFGIMFEAPVFGLPGYPVSCMVAFDLFVRPALKKMMGASDVAWNTAVATLDENLRLKKGRRKFLRGVLRHDGDRLVVKSTGYQGSGVLMSMVLANCLIDVPDEVERLSEGEKVDIILLG